MTTVNLLTKKALNAFWQVVIDQFPEAASSDLSPWATSTLETTAKAAIREWIANNVGAQEAGIATDYRFRLRWQLHSPSGLTGVVTAVNRKGVWARLDQPISGDEQWDNQVHWDTLGDFVADTCPI